jgi:hypothetical protein
MGVNTPSGTRLRDRIVVSALATLTLLGPTSDALAGDLTSTPSGLWVPATALSLTLITEVMRLHK